MNRTVLRSIPLALLLVAGCADAWAQSMSRQIARDLEKMQSYEGITVEEHITTDGPLRRRVTYARPWRVRVETLAPAAHAGELFLYDGAQLVMYWPAQRFGIRVHNLAAPTRADLRRHIERLARDNMAAYAFSLRSQSARVAAAKWAAYDGVVSSRSTSRARLSGDGSARNARTSATRGMRPIRSR